VASNRSDRDELILAGKQYLFPVVSMADVDAFIAAFRPALGAPSAR
jgi:hypothetical protein